MDVDEAQRKIAAILAELEAESDAIVAGIGLNTIDTTGIGDARPQHRVAVNIAMERRPGHDWVT